ncbi:aminobutyraldehyde dehydrogenase [Nocardia amikacinitolerans]|uniref:Aminobutyraldehyde dehydrogenase n=1 Tax=Nocardia amikacinitolerans TaxID=756689 RepID=A0A285LTY8_9NOCA|nr:aldehyde dehydrogenase family protein [Nocardia amikacinitolerans]MCP2274463.1 aminobutyraldehyde dehydrogenase [Nocardia amikacinitolerans]MCP2297199.1 aminobutyraldehyde dehydrogenase [Nocardia amikacinitolerans]SNY88390.1 aminobutyraldehyde dehydrogenase [Nocardia amikacinitolerans]
MITPDVIAAAEDRIREVSRTHFIGGQFRPTDSTETISVTNPATEESLGAIPNGTRDDIDAAVAAARSALPDWSRRTPAARAEMLFALADVVDANLDLLAAVESINGGKPFAAALEEIPVVSDGLRFMAGAARTAQAPAAAQYVPGMLSYIRREPVGVVGAVAPWNFPLMMAGWKIAPILAAGNTLVLKPSQLTPFSILVLMELAGDVLPPGVLNVVLGRGSDIGKALSEHPGIDMMAVTGSLASGQAVARDSAAGVKRVHLELGGKAPVVVFPDADIDDVAQTLVATGYTNAGQDCGAATRVVCHHDVHDLLVDKLVTAAENLVMGDPCAEEGVQLGPVIGAAQRDRIAAMVDQARKDGAKVVTGGAVPDRAGYFYPPTVITDVAPGTEMAREEVFGPVISVETFGTEAEAIAKANDVEYGLAASVWTADQRRALRVVEQLEFGSVWANTHLAFTTEMPWVGFGKSGYGRDNSIYALDDYTRTKHVMLPMDASAE